MTGERIVDGRIQRTVIRRHEYGYRAEPGYLLVDVAQGDPAEALITNRSGRDLTIDLQGRLADSTISLLLPAGDRSARERSARLRRAGIALPAGHTLRLRFRRSLRGVQSYRAFDDEGIEVSGGSGPGIIIER
jgi:hypothetical protein